MTTITRTGIKWLPTTYHHCRSYIEYFKPDNPIFAQIAQQKPIVTPSRIMQARKYIQECQMGKRQLLHIGDCAETFDDCTNDVITRKAIFFRECQKLLSQIKNKPVTIFGRIAGQYAKPRSEQFVIVNGKKIHNYKGDNVNDLNLNQRDPSINKILEGYSNSLKTANILREIYPELCYSHEGLVLPYQQSLTQQYNDEYYCTSSHMIWIGERTRQLDGAHVQFFRGIQNPIGVKVSSKISEQDFFYLVRTLNPTNQNGKLLVIVRMGKNNIESKLDKLVNIKEKEGLKFLFVTDPMHGNTYQSQSRQMKTRSLHDILHQIKVFESKMESKMLPYGYSFQSTYQNVTQCHGMAYPLKQSQLSKETFKSKCDPRLNNQQTKHIISILNQSSTSPNYN